MPAPPYSAGTEQPSNPSFAICGRMFLSKRCSRSAGVAATVTRLDVAVQAWEATAGADDRDTLVAALTDHRAVLLEHLDDEDATLLPLAAEHVTEKEWASLGDHLVTNTPKLTLLTLFGLVLEDANRAERALLAGAAIARQPMRGAADAADCAR